MSNAIITVDTIQPSTGAAPIQVRSKLIYTQVLALDDFADDELVNKRAALALKGTLYTGPVIAAGQAIPYFIDVSSFPGATEDSELIIKIPFTDPTTGISTGKLVRVYDIMAVEQDTVGDGTGTFTGWNVYGHPNGSNQFNEDTAITFRT